MLETKNLSVTYKDKSVIDGFTEVFPERGSLCIFGKSGSGKSTLLKALANLIPFKGDIFLDGRNVHEINPVTYRTRVLYVAQNPPFSEETVRESLMLPFTFKNNELPRPDDKTMASLLIQTGLDESYLNKAPASLSGGEKQRVHLARAFLLNPEYILVDEPTSALDIQSQQNVIEILKERQNTCAVIMVSHTPEVIQSAGEKWYFREGRIAEKYKDLSQEKLYQIFSTLEGGPHGLH